MAERQCEVTVETADGKRHTIRVGAKSVFLAALQFFTRSQAPDPGDKLPATDNETVYEVRVLYRVTEKAVLAWANREAARTLRLEKRHNRR